MSERVFRTAQFFADPNGYTHDIEHRGWSEIRKNIEFYILNTLNKDTSVKIDHKENDFTDEERERWFGKKHLSYDDLSWQNCENLLRPSAREHAVCRVNGALDGSYMNELFSAIVGQGRDGGYSNIGKAIYTPRTVTVYDSKDQAVAVAKFLRIITQGSGATIIAEPIQRTVKEPLWVVSDNMNLSTHNALRMFMTSLSRHQSNQTRVKCTKEAQQNVDKRMPKGQHWEAFEGVGSLLTLQGRPGIKMYKKLPSGKDDPEDVKRIGLLPDQKSPRFMQGVPIHSVVARDGRRLFNDRNTLDVMSHMIIGPRMTSLLTEGKFAVMGDVFVDEVGSEYVNAATAPSVAGKAGRAAEIAVDISSKAVSKTTKAAAATVAAGVTAAGMGSATALHAVGKKAVGSWRWLMRRGYREPRSLLSPVKRAVEQKAGYRLNASRHGKVWELRDALPPADIVGTELDPNFTIKEPDGFSTPIGDIAVDREIKSWVQKIDISTQDIGKAFDEYLIRNHKLPTVQSITAGKRFYFPPEEFSEEFKDAMHHLAQVWARWTITSMVIKEGLSFSTVGIDRELISNDLAKALNQFNATLHQTYRLPADTSNHIRGLMRDTLCKGMKDFLKQQCLSR